MRCVLESSEGLSKGEVDDQGWEETDLVGSCRTFIEEMGTYCQILSKRFYNIAFSFLL